MTLYALYNPLAGNDDINDKISPLSAIYNDPITFLDITKLDYAEFFSGLTENDKVILCGGDGTLNNFANKTFGMDIKCDILYYAVGTGNDFLRDAKKTNDEPPFSVKEYLKELPFAEVNGKTYRFINNVGFGIDGYCCEIGDKLKKDSSKPVNYTAIAIKGLLFHYKPTNATVIVDGKKYVHKKVWLAPTMKGRFYGGGMMPTPCQNRNDPEGKLSVMLFFGKGRLRTLMAFPSIFKGEHVKHKDMVAIYEGKNISIKFDRPAAVQIDGETILGVTEYKAFSKLPSVSPAGIK